MADQELTNIAPNDEQESQVQQAPDQADKSQEIASDSAGGKTEAGPVEEPESAMLPSAEAARLAPYVHGALQLIHVGDGYVQPLRYYPKQMGILEDKGLGRFAHSCAGVSLRVLTRATELSFECRVLGGLEPESPFYQAVMERQGELGRPEAGVLDGIDVVVAGVSHSVPVSDGVVRVDIANAGGELVPVTIQLPSIMSVAVRNLRANGEMLPVPPRGYLLALGDSISQGYVVGCPSMAWPVRVAEALDMDIINQAFASGTFDRATLRGLAPLGAASPGLVTVAFGSNDWERAETAVALENDAREYLDKLVWRFPLSPILVLSPLWRADADREVPCGKPLSWVRDLLRDLCDEHENLHFVDVYDGVAHNPLIFADGFLHPGSVGAELVAEQVVLAACGEDADIAETPLVPTAGAAARMERRSASAEELADEQNRAHVGAPGVHPEFDRLVRTIWRLRQPDGCPWDREQTHESIGRNMIEEAYEALDAIEEGKPHHVREELGDVLMQVLLHAQMGADAGEYDIDDVCATLNQKLVRRHPHVFGDLAASDAGEVRDIWEDVKDAERASDDERPSGLLDSVPRALPALMAAQKISKRAAAAGFEWETLEDVWAKVDEERAEYLAEEAGSPSAEVEFGDLLFALVNIARWQGIDAEAALRASNDKFRRRWAAMEQAAQESGEDLSAMSTQRLNELWDAAK